MSKVINYYKTGKPFSIESFTFCRNHDQIAAEAALDGIYVLRTNLPSTSGPTAM